jgi:hypothetical protein
VAQVTALAVRNDPDLWLTHVELNITALMGMTMSGLREASGNRLRPIAMPVLLGLTLKKAP